MEMFSCARDGLLGFPMAGFRPNHGLNAYSCGAAGIFTPFPHPERMGEWPLAPRTLSSVCLIVWLYYSRKRRKAKQRTPHTGDEPPAGLLVIPAKTQFLQGK